MHGALCVCYSGQCLMSSMIGGRSGNRGRCAQPCRLAYTLVDAQGKEVKAEGAHLLSPRDLKMVENLPLLAAAKVSSLKVEGRMKRPEYVAVVIRNYREALDRFYADEETYLAAPETFSVSVDAEKELAQIFNREFTTGYFLEKPGPHLMSYQRPNNRGVMIGRVTRFDPRTGRVTVRLEEPLAVGDGYVIWVTKGGRIAGEIKSLRKGKATVSRAEGGEEVSFSIQGGRPQAGDRVFKTLDAALMEKATSTYASVRNEKKSHWIWRWKLPKDARCFWRPGTGKEITPGRGAVYRREGTETSGHRRRYQAANAAFRGYSFLPGGLQGAPGTGLDGALKRVECVAAGCGK